MEVLGILAVVAVAVAALAISLHLKAKRRAAFQAFALQHGLVYAQGDPFGLLGWPFDLLRRGDGRGIDHVVWGTWRKTAVQAFDYWYYTETTDSKGHRSRSYRRFSCVVIEVPAAFPHLTMAREGVFTRLADHLGMEDIEFESPEFNRRYNVKARDRKFAYELIDGRMLEWLVGVRPGLGLRGHGQPGSGLRAPGQAERATGADRDRGDVPRTYPPRGLEPLPGRRGTLTDRIRSGVPGTRRGHPRGDGHDRALGDPGDRGAGAPVGRGGLQPLRLPAPGDP
jgi:hypothetical protein